MNTNKYWKWINFKVGNSKNHKQLLENQCYEIQNYDYIDQLSFDPQTSRLYVLILNYDKRPKITRYIQRNYERTPIYGGYSEKTRKVKEINKVIFPKKFLEEELEKMDISLDFKLEIFQCISSKIDDYVPFWIKKEMDIEEFNNEKQKLQDEIQKNNNLLLSYNNKLENLARRKSLTNATRKVKSSVFHLIFGIILLPILIGIILLATYTSQTKATNNVEENKKAINEYDNFNAYFMREQKRISVSNNSNENKILEIELQIVELRNQEFKFIEDEEGFIDLRKAINFSHKEIIKGVYIIWNKTKNIYYVGQSKDINKRLFTQHFKKGDVSNIIFAKDWFNNDEFAYKIIQLETKDELDACEKEYISKYNCFGSGYNKTSGNK